VTKMVRLSVGTEIIPCCGASESPSIPVLAMFLADS
jgi:hypothetical protein